MELKNCVILRGDDPMQEQNILKKLIFEEVLILGIVVGNNPWAVDQIIRIDKTSLLRSNIRKGVWIQDKSAFSGILNGLFENSSINPNDKNYSYIFSLSLDDKVCDIINEPTIIDNSRAHKLFLNAEISESL